MRRTRKCKVSEKNPPSPVRSNSKGEKVPIGKGVGCARTRNHRGFWALLHTGLGGKKIPIDEVFLFLKSYNEMVNHRQKKIVPKSDGEWLI